KSKPRGRLSMAFAHTARRPIAGAVATIGVSDRVAFLRKTYGLLGIALIAFAVLTGGMMRLAPETSLRFSSMALGNNGFNWLIVIALFMGVGYLARNLAMSQTSRGLQLAGLGIFVVAESLLLQPLLWILIAQFGSRITRHSGALFT